MLQVSYQIAHVYEITDVLQSFCKIWKYMTNPLSLCLSHILLQGPKGEPGDGGRLESVRIVYKRSLIIFCLSVPYKHYF